jgi:hypothetical protein
MLFVTTVSLAINTCKIGKSSNAHVGRYLWLQITPPGWDTGQGVLCFVEADFSVLEKNSIILCELHLLAISPVAKLQNIGHLVPLCLKKSKRTTYDYSTNLHSRHQSEELQISDVPMMHFCCIKISFPAA